MNQVLKSLDEITTGFSVFEKNQVLTHVQLNSIANYCDDQTRLTRVNLWGVGIVCGLRVSVQGGQIKVGQGLGVTTDGDLLHFAVDTLFDRFKLYDDSNPAYAPFFVNDTLIKIYELLPPGTEDPRATDLNQFEAETGIPLGNWAAVLFMEGFVKDNDLCTGDDCDNLGKDFINTTKLLLVEKSSLGLLKRAIPTPHQAAHALSELVADRPLLASSLDSAEGLAVTYRTACNSIHAQLTTELTKVFPNCSFFLGEVFAADPGGAWSARLNALNAAFATNAFGIQYYYDFLKDLVETYNHFRELLDGVTAWCCPQKDSFAKHLLLGNVLAGADPNENRTAFYPSPAVSEPGERLDYAKFLARKLDVLIQTFQPPALAELIRITPSRFEDAPLDERAIPYYYPVNAANPIHIQWNHLLRRQGLEARNYSYHAPSYHAQGGAARPLTSQLGRFSFFRIEGHLGHSVASAQAFLERTIQENNLPFAVKAVLLGKDRDRVVKKPDIRYTDLHRLHDLFRLDVYDQLKDVASFSSHYRDRIVQSVDQQQEEDAPILKQSAIDNDARLREKIKSAQTKVDRAYSAYRADPSWKNDVLDSLDFSAESKSAQSKVVKTDFPTPMDALITHRQVYWLDWLDELIDQKEEQEDTRLLWGKFLTEHPGVEHFAGVSRGGTFVLIYDENGRVVGDVMLAYRCCETVEEEPAKSPLTKPGVKPDRLITKGIKINPSLDRNFRLKLDKFKADEVEVRFKELEPRFNVQKEYFDFFKDSMTTVADVFSNARAGTVRTGGLNFTDRLLEAVVNETRAKHSRLDVLKGRMNQPGLPQDARNKLAQQIKEVEADLAKSIVETARHVSETGANVAPGGEGFAAMVDISRSVNVLADSGARSSVKTGLNQLRDSARNADFRVIVGNMINF